ncbi:MAG: hypothetical protein FJ008_06465 [Chloroflexi bacterium]|nr:hypothetical protein [Chloroflexota bacterium]MBM4451978.1 hypothetical protein [Chloroflexota bacterium]
MNENKLRLFACAMILLSLSSQLPGCGFGPFGTKNTAIAPLAGKPAEFEVSPLAISPAMPMAGDTIKVSATVKNVGDSEGTFVAILIIDGEESGRRNALVAPSSSSTVSFQVGDVAAGMHEMGIGTSQVNITVHSWAPYTIKYCKGHSDWVLFSTDIPTFRSTDDVGQIVHFTPPTVPFKIQKVKICGEANTENPLDLHKRHFTMRIWNKDKNQQLWSRDFPWSVFTGQMSWQQIMVPDIRVEDDFYVEVVTHSDPGNQAKNYLDIGFEMSRDALPVPRRLEFYRLNAFECRSGWSRNGQPIEPPCGKPLINWHISVDGEGPPPHSP